MENKFSKLTMNIERKFLNILKKEAVSLDMDVSTLARLSMRVGLNKLIGGIQK